ncbi:MAG: DUF4468 domain-containing protein [Bacteroidota bacterium]
MNSIIKSFLILILSVAFIFNISAQKKDEIVYQKPDLPIDETSKLITYTKVVQTSGTSEELFRKGLNWFNTYYKNPADVIREKDQVAGKIVGKGRLKILNPPDKNAVQTMKGIVLYTLTTEFKEGRFKYTVTDINLKSASYYACEQWLEAESPTYSQVYNFFLQQVNDQIIEAITNLENEMTKAPENKPQDW